MTETFDPAAIMAAQRAKSLARGLNVRCPICGSGVGKFCSMPEQSKDREFRGSHTERGAVATSDVMVEPPRISDRELLIAAGAVGCDIIDNGRPCDLRYGHRGRHWSAR